LEYSTFITKSIVFQLTFFVDNIILNLNNKLKGGFLKKILFFFCLTLISALVALPNSTSAIIGNPGGGGGGGPSQLMDLKVTISFTFNNLICGQDNNVGVMVTNDQNSPGEVTNVGLGFSNNLGAQVKSPQEGADGNWTAAYSNDVDEGGDYSNYAGITWQSGNGNGLQPGGSGTFSGIIYIPCNGSQSGTVVGSAKNPKSNIADILGNVSIGENMTQLPQTGSESLNLFWVLILGVPILKRFRYFF
jgi:hypothetical protein